MNTTEIPITSQDMTAAREHAQNEYKTGNITRWEYMQILGRSKVRTEYAKNLKLLGEI